MADVVILFADVERILDAIYDGTKPARVQFLICACGAIADLTQGDEQAAGWQVLPHAVCPECLQPYAGPARDRFMDLVDQLLVHRKAGC